MSCHKSLLQAMPKAPRIPRASARLLSLAHQLRESPHPHPRVLYDMCYGNFDPVLGVGVQTSACKNVEHESICGILLEASSEIRFKINWSICYAFAFGELPVQNVFSGLFTFSSGMEVLLFAMFSAFPPPNMIYSGPLAINSIVKRTFPVAQHLFNSASAEIIFLLGNDDTCCAMIAELSDEEKLEQPKTWR